jgi:tetratricopeptide (TPR) repeat protein
MRRLLAMLTIAGSLAAHAAAHAAAPADCWALRKHGQATKAQACFEGLTRAGDAYSRAEGFWGLEEWDEANEQFRVATQPAGAPPMYKVRWGMLLHQRFNEQDAADLFHEALAKEPGNAQAYFGLGTVSAEGFDGKAMEYAAKAIELDPKLAEAHELAATLALENDDRVTAAKEADKAIALETDALDAMAVHAALELIADRPPEEWLGKIKAINPGYGEAYAQVAHHLELHYRYEDAATYYRKAVEADPRLWSAHSSLGIELMRLGQEQEPLKELELAYNNGYRNAATVNSLRLLNSYKNFETTRDATTILKLNKTEAELLRPYFEAELHTILTTYNAKYHMTLPGPVQVEVYPDHEDFAVRTMGMPGLGALGVTFGEVVAMDSPSGRKPGEFNWGATLWHEMSHVYIITATHGRVPRWFTEGLAVHEEGERSKEWSDRITPDVLVAIRAKKLLPVASLDRGFVFPEYPGQVLVSYFQAGSLCGFIQQKWGEGKLLEMVHSYAQLKSTPEVIEVDLGLSAEEFDKQYSAWLEKTYATELGHFDEWRAGLKAVAAASEAKQYDTVLTLGTPLLTMYPEYVGDANVYEMLADADKAKGDTKAEADVLIAYEHAGGEQPAVLKRLAKLEEDLGQPAEAAATLERLNYIYPVKDEDLHRHLGDLLYAGKQYDGAIREYAAVVAMNPLDKAGAEFHLAEAYLAAGQTGKAEESVLLALEAAPGYRPAQKMLLELNKSTAKTN